MRWERRSRRGDVIYARGGGMRRRGGLPMGRAGAGGAVGIVYLLISQLGGGGTSFGVDSGFPSGVWARTVYEAGDLDEGDVRRPSGPPRPWAARAATPESATPFPQRRSERSPGVAGVDYGAREPERAMRLKTRALGRSCRASVRRS
jgi:hypothetical protein